MKHLFKFTIDKKEVVEVVEKSTNEKGEEVSITKKEEKLIPQKFLIRKPSRSLLDEGKLYHGVKFADAIKAGLLPISLLSKRFSNDKGVLSEPEREKYGKLFITLEEKKSELEKISAKAKEERSDEENKQHITLTLEITNIYRDLQEMESQQMNLYSNTAEVYARDNTSIWWIMNLSYKEGEKGELTPVYGSETDKTEKRIDLLDEAAESSDEFTKKVFNTFVFLINLWFTGKINTQKDFEEAFTLVNFI